jgi:SAM-dependent methyltransferase
VSERIANVIERAAGMAGETGGAEPRRAGWSLGMAGEASRVEPRRERLAGNLGGVEPRRAGRLLEIGVGTGRISLPLHRRGRRMVGIDLSEPMLERYRVKAAADRLAAPAVVRGDATRLPFRDALFDAVIEVHVLHLIPQWRRAVAEVRRVLVPGGVLVVARRYWTRSEGNGPRSLARKRHNDILAEWGLGVERVGIRGDAEMIQGFAELGGRVEDLEPVSWWDRQTWSEQLDILERRVWSHSWRVPEAPWLEAARRLRSELAAEGVDLDEPVMVQRHVDLSAIRF